jgi:hypothetical protein
VAEGLAVVIAAALSWIAGSRIGQWALIALAFAAAMFGFHRSAKNAGRAEAESEQARQTLDNVKDAKDAQDSVDAAGPDDLERMRDKWTR